ncbi:MAG: F0F1 ATP synthase subunit delta [Pseudomonadota bacterium]
MSEPTSISNGIAARYATAVFELAKDGKALPALETDITSLNEALHGSDDLRGFFNSPVYSRDEMEKAVVAFVEKAGFSDIIKNTLALMAQNRRLFVVPAFVERVKALLAEEKGEVTAEVITSKALTKTQADKLAKVLKAQVGKDVNMEASVDESLIGGMIVKVGSRMVDTSIRSKLAALQNTMKEVG